MSQVWSSKAMGAAEGTHTGREQEVGPQGIGDSSLGGWLWWKTGDKAEEDRVRTGP